MLNLIYLLFIPIIFIGCLLITSNNYHKVNPFIQMNRLSQMISLEESSYIIPYVLQKYYSWMINIKSELIPLIITTSYWYENLVLVKNRVSKRQNDLKTNILKRISLAFTLIMYGLIILF